MLRTARLQLSESEIVVAFGEHDQNPTDRIVTSASANCIGSSCHEATMAAPS